MKKLFTLFAAAMACVSAMAWTAQPKDNSQFYIYNEGAGLWIGVSADGKPFTYADKAQAQLFTIDKNYFYYMNGGSKLYISQSKGVSAFANKGAGITTWTDAGNNHYYMDDHTLIATGDTRYMDATGDGNQLSFPKRDNKSANYNTWILIAPAEYADSMRTFTELETIEATVGVEIEIFNKPYTFSEVGDVTINDTLQSVLGFDSVLVQPVHVVEPIVTALPENKEAVKAVKVLRNGQLLIRREDVLFDLRGQRVK